MSARDEAGLDLLKRELEVNCVSWSEFLPLWAQETSVANSVLRELLVAVDPAIHEGHIAPYASLIANDARSIPLLRLKPEHLALARKAADGRSTITVFEREMFAGLLAPDPSLDLDLALSRLAVSSDGVSIHRDEKGHVRAYSPNGALRNIGRQWSQSPSIYQAIQTILRVAPTVDETVLTRLVEFSYLILSPRHIGAILVWVLSDRNPFAGQGDDLTPLRLTTQDGSASRLLSFADHLLAQYDGATIISRSGDVISTGVHLAPSTRALELVAGVGGTRHTSSKRISFDCADTLIFTISSDGPVTVFSDGVSVFRLRWLSAADIASSPTRDGWVVVSSQGLISCPKCGKVCEIETLTACDADPHLEVACPVCSQILATMSCIEARATIQKRF